MKDYNKAIEKSKIPRINYKKVLGTTLWTFISKNVDKSEEEIVYHVLKTLREDKEALRGWDFSKVVQNVKISVSSHLSRLKQRIKK